MSSLSRLLRAAYQKGSSYLESEALDLALDEAARGYGHTSPNPAVGCVILDSAGKLLSTGYHHKAGEPHAEIEALNALHIKNVPATFARVFVTLEPCAHQGRTPSCAKTLAALPIAEVTAILRDPNPLVAGQGFQILRDAGIKVRCLEEDPQSDHERRLVRDARTVCEFFLTNMTEQRPFVSLKVATSLDGMLALKSGDSRWITSRASRNFARFLRGAHDACLVGVQTVLCDDPLLDARETVFESKQRILVILDSDGKVLKNPSLKIFESHSPENILVVVGDSFAGAEGSQIQPHPLAKILCISQNESPKKYWRTLMQELWAQGSRSLWIEGGAQTLSSCLNAGIGDRLWLFQGPSLIGGLEGRPWTEGLGLARMEDRIELSGLEHLSIGSDHLISGHLIKKLSHE